jgi:uncharacterized protein with beta-barrel porin domain
MKTISSWIIVITLAILLAGCGVINNFGVTVITPSNVLISENRDVSGFTGINFSAMGKVNIIQGTVESLNINGPDNLVPEITTTVTNGTLIIKTKPNVTINPLGADNPLTFTISVKNLTSLNLSGLGDVQAETLTTPSMDINMSGAGKLVQNQISTTHLTLTLSGLGGMDITGSADSATIDLSGAGSVNAPDLQLKTADITISGLGGATVWVTDQLNGNISGAGSVSYYGNPQTNVKSSGLGSFKSLGNK